MNLREALKEAEDLGCQVNHVYRTGELRVKAPDRPRTVKVNSRRKDCPKSLETVVNQLRRKRDQSASENSQHGRSPAGSGGHHDLSATKEYFCRRDLSVLRKLVKTISSDLRSPIDVDADIHLILRKVRA